MSAIRILVADRHHIFRDGLRKLLDAEPGFLVVGEAGEGVEAVRLARSLQPDVMLLELVMPELPGLEVLRELAMCSPGLRTIVLTAAIERPQVIQALQRGAWGIVKKDSRTEVLFEAIRSVLAGRHWLGEDNVADLLQVLRELAPLSGTAPRKEPRSTAAPRKEKFGLTPRELEVTETVAAGYTNKEIAHEFAISEETVKHHLSNIFDKVGVWNRLELALFAVYHRLVDQIEPVRSTREP